MPRLLRSAGPFFARSPGVGAAMPEGARVTVESSTLSNYDPHSLFVMPRRYPDKAANVRLPRGGARAGAAPSKRRQMEGCALREVGSNVLNPVDALRWPRTGAPHWSWWVSQ